MLMRSHPILSRFLIWVIFPLLVVFGGAYFWLLESLPKKEGVVQVKGLKAPVKITRDEYAIPHIIAETDMDAFFALGYVHAQERLWQMMYKRRMAEGRLSEILGIDFLPMDQYLRAYDLVNAAELALASLSEPAQQVLKVYTEGVNAWINEGQTLPIEFYIFGVKPKLWKPLDTILMIKLMSLTLGPNHTAETEFDLLVKEVGLDKANDIVPNINAHVSAGADVYENTLADSKLEKELIAANDRLLDQFKLGGEIAVGSNAWAVSGRYTQSGLPLLASDPHLLTEMPSLWYLANIKGDRLHVSGATFAGVPLVFMGRNQSVAWGITNMFPDALDLYMERTNPLNPNQYEVDGKWVDMEIEEQVINIKAAFPSFLTRPIPPVKWQVRKTRNGPLISDGIRRVETPLSMRWAALDKVDKTFESYLGMNYAQDMSSFQSALESYKAPAVNIIYADKDNNIARFAAGKLPIRKKGNGRRPVPGWNSDYQWEKYIPFDELPHNINPRRGFVVNANNKNHPDNYPYVILNVESPPYRVDRITQAIQDHIDSGEKMSVKDFVTLQGDSKSLQVKELLPYLSNLSGITTDQKKAIKKLQEWDGILRGDSEETAIYQVWLKFFNLFLIGDDLKGSLLHEARGNQLQNIPPAIQPLLIIKLFQNDPDLNHDWCDQINTVEYETCEDLALIALDSTLEELDRKISFSKEWEDINEVYLPHLAFMNHPLLDSIFSRTIEGNSDRFSINRADWRYTQEYGYRVFSTAGYRQVLDLSGQDQSGFINSTGQSEHLLSKHYDDNIQAFKQLKLRPMNLVSGQNADKYKSLYLKPIK
ncbi:penicillin acylase family protein [Marinibactrum halimedae]|uniref:Penicillin amidase n=1 Tax=Marinibactrum halimedae TaxID=1444977 RepID=A0AA37WJZ8_9GAMM|nr:penicillin acylase family protein [Marinibactrum halimedae]MCD9460850.1 penicillin acylase family protein [Marinibactrum halimedae]GLS24558.1 penicillin amidase [Marinibactrum halimedae]